MWAANTKPLSVACCITTLIATLRDGNCSCGCLSLHVTNMATTIWLLLVAHLVVCYQLSHEPQMATHNCTFWFSSITYYWHLRQNFQFRCRESNCKCWWCKEEIVMGMLCGCIWRLYQESRNLLVLHTWMSKPLASSYLLGTYVKSHAAHVKETILCCIVFMIEDEEDKKYVGTFSMIVNRHRNQNVIFFLVVLFTSWEALIPSKTNWPETLFLKTNRNSCRCVYNLRFKCFSCIPSQHH